MSKRFWRVMFVITIVSLITTFIFGSDIPWSNLKNTSFSWPITKGILYDISVGVFASMILVWCIDRFQMRESEKKNAQQRLILYCKLAPVLNEYYEFYLKLFIATRNKPVEKENKVLKSLFYCKDEFLKQIRETEPFYKNGCYVDGARYELRNCLWNENKDNPQALHEIDKMNIEMPWYKCWCRDGRNFYSVMSQIEKAYIILFPNELLENINELLKIVGDQVNMDKFVEGEGILTYSMVNYNMPKLETDFFINAYKIEKILELLNDIMEYIEKDSSLKLRERELKFFNERNVCPLIGHSCGNSENIE